MNLRDKILADWAADETDRAYLADQELQHGAAQTAARILALDTADRLRYRHAPDGLANEAHASGIQCRAGLLVTEISQAIITAEGDAPGCWIYMRDTIVDDLLAVLLEVSGG